MAITFPKSTPEIFQVHILASPEHPSPRPCTTAIPSPQHGPRGSQFPWVKITFPLLSTSSLSCYSSAPETWPSPRLWGGGLANPSLVHHGAGGRAKMPQQSWWSAERARRGWGYTSCYSPTSYDGASTGRKPSQQLPCSTQRHG